MTEEELRRFVAVDGHVGLEEEQEHAARFRRFFPHVAWEPRYALCLSSEEFVKQRDEYGLPFERGLRRVPARPLASRSGAPSTWRWATSSAKSPTSTCVCPKSGLYMFLKASDAPLGPFYNEHRDRRGALRADAPRTSDEPPTRASASTATRARFDDGWYEPNVLPPVARWMGARGARALPRPALSAAPPRPDHAHARPRRRAPARPRTAPQRRAALAPSRSSATAGSNCALDVPDDLPPRRGDFELEIRADRTWQPRPDDADEPRRPRAVRRRLQHRSSCQRLVVSVSQQSVFPPARLERFVEGHRLAIFRHVPLTAES